MDEHDVAFGAMGSQIRLVIGESPGMPPAAEAAERARAFAADFEATLSRFRPESELSALNADPRPVVPASALLRAAVEAGLAAARRTSGLVDSTLLGKIEATGYVASSQTPVESLAGALASAPPRRRARPGIDSPWSRFEVDDEAGTVIRPPGARLDPGGIGKGLAADLIAASLRGYPRFVVDCGGDVRIGGSNALIEPFDVVVEHPLTGQGAYVLKLGSGAVATSGLNVRIWRGRDGRPRHHLLDPATGEPAWTGLIGATALGDTAVEAEALAKAALLSGPDGGRDFLSELGGLLVHDDGAVETIGPIGVQKIDGPDVHG